MDSIEAPSSVTLIYFTTLKSVHRRRFSPFPLEDGGSRRRRGKRRRRKGERVDLKKAASSDRSNTSEKLSESQLRIRCNVLFRNILKLRNDSCKMRAVIKRVAAAGITVKSDLVSSIDQGLCVFTGKYTNLTIVFKLEFLQCEPSSLILRKSTTTKFVCSV